MSDNKNRSCKEDNIVGGLFALKNQWSKTTFDTIVVSLFSLQTPRI